MRVKALIALLLLALALPALAAASDQHWIHVKVDDHAGDEHVTVNLPVSLMRAAAALIPEEVQEDARIEIDELDMSWDDLMTFWQEVRNAPEATFVTVETRDETVKVRKEGDFVLVKTTERGERGADVDVRFPLAVVDGLLSGPEGTLNFEAALDALIDYGPGNLVSVRDDEHTVRVWIDDQNETD